MTESHDGDSILEAVVLCDDQVLFRGRKNGGLGHSFC